MRRASYLCLLLAACSSTPSTPPAPSETPAPEPPASETGPSAEPWSTIPPKRSGSLLAKVDDQRLRAQLQKNHKPINIKHRCGFLNETGYKGSTHIEIAHGEVKQLATRIEVPLAGGRCDFEFNGFRQTARSPAIELRHPEDGCTVRIWAQGPQLTVSYTQCATRCSSAETFKSIWPVLIDQASGKCD